MKVNIDIKEDADFRKHVKDMLSGEIRGMLRTELKGIVFAEIAKLRLLQPDAPELSKLIEKSLHEAVSSQLRRMDTYINMTIRQAVQAELVPMKDKIGKQLKVAMKDYFANLDP